LFWMVLGHSAGVTARDGCVDVLLHRRHNADDEKGLVEGLDDSSMPVTRLWASGLPAPVGGEMLSQTECKKCRLTYKSE
jgi:hypothetical protein